MLLCQLVARFTISISLPIIFKTNSVIQRQLRRHFFLERMKVWGVGKLSASFELSKNRFPQSRNADQKNYL